MGEEDDLYHDPFKALGGPDSMEGDGEIDEKDKISFTYSNYIAALEKEELLNNTDETSFTSLLTDTGRSSPITSQLTNSLGLCHKVCRLNYFLKFF